MPDIDELSRSPDYSPWTKWFWGCVIPLAILGYSLWSMARGSITLPGKRTSLEIIGTDVYILAAAYMALGAFIHFHCYWNLYESLWVHVNRLKALSLLVFLPCIVTVVLHAIGVYLW